MKKILFYSNNNSKIKEVKRLFNKYKITILSPQDFNINDEPNENGKSFAENAKIKSDYGFKKFKIPCISDDSGICIEALNWKPGINSKLFLLNFKNKRQCFEKIIEIAQKKSTRKAYFKTSISFTFENDYNVIFEGKSQGLISTKPMGKKGFGYDPIFMPNGYNKTLGQLSITTKNKISHRSIAINKLIDFLIN